MIQHMDPQAEDATITPLPSETALVDLRSSALRCRGLLYHLTTQDDGLAREADELMAAFNILAANMGIFRQGQHSLQSRLQNTPEIESLIKQLLNALQRHLQQFISETGQKGVESDDSDDSSDRSSILPAHNDIMSDALGRNAAVYSEKPSSVSLSSARGTITSLRQISLTLRLASAQHRADRLKRFRDTGLYSQVFDLFYQYALQTAKHTFPQAPDFLINRVADSLASRRIRFLYVERHQAKITTVNEPAPALPQNREQKCMEQSEPEVQYTAASPPKAFSQPSLILSNTEITKIDPKRVYEPLKLDLERPESVSSVHVTSSRFPTAPRLDSGGLSFTCPYCFLSFPVSNIRNDQARMSTGSVSDESVPAEAHSRGMRRLPDTQWRKHLMRDFEPFFCVLETCSSPFFGNARHRDWLAHLRDRHSPPTWVCLYCKSPKPKRFHKAEDLDKHLRNHHNNQVPSESRPAVIKEGMSREQVLLTTCPFCGGFPEEIEKQFPNRKSSQAQDSLIAHIREHLVSIALMLAPIRGEESEGSNASDNIGSSLVPDSGHRSSQDMSSIREESGSGLLICSRAECDCKASSQVPTGRLPAAESLPGWVVEDSDHLTTITSLWNEIRRENTNGMEDEEQPVIKAFSSSQKPGSFQQSLDQPTKTADVASPRISTKPSGATQGQSRTTSPSQPHQSRLSENSTNPRGNKRDESLIPNKTAERTNKLKAASRRKIEIFSWICHCCKSYDMLVATTPLCINCNHKRCSECSTLAV